MNLIKKTVLITVILALTLTSAAFGYEVQYEYNDGIAVVKDGDKFGYVTENGTELVPCTYDYAFDFSDGMANVVLNNKCGYINKTGALVIPCEYEGATDFSEGGAAVQKNGKWAFVNKEGTFLTEFVYDEVGFFNDGFARVQIGDSYGYVNLMGQEVVPCMFDEANAYIALYNAPKVQPVYAGTVIPIASKVTVDGIEKKLDAYEIEDYNYVKLRSLADALADSNAPVTVDWDPEKERIILTQERDYSNECELIIVTEEATEDIPEEVIEEATEEVVEETEEVVEATEEVVEETVEEVTEDPTEEVVPVIDVDAIPDELLEVLSGEPVIVGQAEEAAPVVLDENPVVFKSTCDILYNDKVVNLEGYEINGNNYFKLREITELFGIGINWNEAMQRVEITTK